MPADLDGIEAYAKSGDDTELLALVAEAHAARELIDVAREGFPRIWIGEIRARANATLAAYDKVTKETSQ